MVPSQQETKRFCEDWIRQERGLPLVTSDDVSDDVLTCPCTLQQALMDTTRYQPDPDCNNLNTKDTNLNCLYRASARHCIRLGEPGYVLICNLKKKKKQIIFYMSFGLSSTYSNLEHPKCTIIKM